VAAYERVARAVRGEGTRLFVQLFHGGRELIAAAPRPVAVSASALPSHRYHTEPRALSTGEVEETIAAYARCAAIAARAGLDGIEVTAAHGYLGEQFFTPEWNRREDRFGVPARFMVEVLEAVRDAAPGLALGVRLSADSAPARAVAGELAPLVDFMHVAVGNSATFDGCSGIVPPPPIPRNLIAELTGPFRLGPPLIATTRVVEPADADAIVARGAADAVGMNRALIADPDLPRKARAGRAREVLRCIGCNACIAHYHAGTPIRCAVNPRTGRERTWAPVAPGNAAGLRVVVVGAGPAGLAAAAEAAAAGHEVIVVERAAEIGGQVRLAGRAPGHRELAATFIANYEVLLDRPEVELSFGVDADAQAVIDLEPDLVVVASGAGPFAPPHALHGVEVVQAWDVLGGARPRGRIVVADWGGDAAGVDCAELLAGEGRDVTLAVGAVTVGETLHQYTRNGYIARLSRAGVRIEHYLGLREALDGTVRLRNVLAPELETEIEADALVVALGRVPADGLAADLRAHGVTRVEQAGDCRSPRGIEEAVLEGTLAARRATPAPLHSAPAGP
jgi:2,4-dienoyl-CoA reductase-like NADH-dependent reductase (Old Yellow Enzyme family)/thioredoxin reductase